MDGKRGKAEENTWLGFKELVHSRRSYKHSFSPRHVEMQVINDCIKLATLAPSPHNGQQWRFITFFKQRNEDEQVRQQLLDGMTKTFFDDLIGDGMKEKAAAAVAKASQTRFLNAPALILVLLDPASLHSYPDEQRNHHELIMGVQGVAAATQVLLLALEARGVSACWYCAPLFCPSHIKQVLKVPTTWQPQSFITAGYPALEKGKSAHPRPARTGLDEIAFRPSSFKEAGA